MVIEAPMGEGKTEAALAAAEVLAFRFGSGGVFIGMPTMATSSAMFRRVEDWVERLSVRSPQSMFLAHGKARLDERFQGLLKANVNSSSRSFASWKEEPYSEEAVIAHSWLSGRRKGVLASFVVGTIDQLLFAALKSRYLTLRHLALANKIVIMDEVHAYDAYMSVFLARAIHWLGAYRVPTILLSATLPHARRDDLVRAYQDGWEGGGADRPVRRRRKGRGYAGTKPSSAECSEPLAEEAAALCQAGYPSILCATKEAQDFREVEVASEGRSVVIERLDDSLDVLAGRLRVALQDGGCAVIVRNTVTRVQETADHLRGVFSPEVVEVAHSRFVSCDRARKDDELRRRFGPPGASGRARRRRPSKSILVASQVVEQSLDIDFDLMISDLAPMDLMLQRMGRLHRHVRMERPERVASPRFVITGVTEWDGEPPQPCRGSVSVYEEYPLLRTLAVLEEAVPADGLLHLPEDISRLVQLAYSDQPVGPPSWRADLDDAYERHRVRKDERTRRARTFLLSEVGVRGEPIMGWVDAGVGDAEGTNAGDARGVAAVRDGADGIEVLVVYRDDAGDIRTLPWLDEGRGDRLIPLEMEPDTEIARTIADCSLRLPFRLCAPWVIDETIRDLERNYFSGWQRSPFLRGQLPLVLEQQAERLSVSVAGTRMVYDKDSGLEVVHDD